MVDAPQDEPQRPLLVRGNAQDLHSRLQLSELLRGALLIVGLRRQPGNLLRTATTPGKTPTVGLLGYYTDTGQEQDDTGRKP